MSYSLECQLVTGLSITKVKDCLVDLGWRVDLAGEQAISATKIEVAEQLEFSAIVCCQPRAHDSQLIVRIETTDRQSESACERQIQKFLEAVKKTCRNGEGVVS
jgi:hypothetical protein